MIIVCHQIQLLLLVAFVPNGRIPQGDLLALPLPSFLVAAIKAAVERAGVKAEDIDEVIMGCILTAGIGQGPASSSHA